MSCYWYGYGNWLAPYWFVGMEPGGHNTVANAVTWKRLGGGELIDCREHHLLSDVFEWHRESPNIQNTWGPLIRLLLIVKGRAQSDSLVRFYQRDAWGAAKGETVVAELSALSAPSLDTEVNRTLHREHRKKILRERLTTYKPKFVLFYGTTYQTEWETLIGTQFDAEGFAQIGSTIAALTLHPTSRPVPSLMYWASFAHALKNKLKSAGALNL